MSENLYEGIRMRKKYDGEFDVHDEFRLEHTPYRSAFGRRTDSWATLRPTYPNTPTNVNKNIGGARQIEQGTISDKFEDWRQY